jgi:uncharacterized protein YndB with AHSA1/START domain
VRTLVNPAGTPASALVLQRLIDAPPELVFAVWSDPAHVAAWWHPEGFTTPAFDMDFRVGGGWRFCIRKDGQDTWASGTYREIAAPARIAFTFRWQTGDSAHLPDSLVAVTFEPRGEQTLLTLRQEPFAADAERHRHGQGWSQLLESFDAFVVGQVVATQRIPS